MSPLVCSGAIGVARARAVTSQWYWRWESHILRSNISGTGVQRPCPVLDSDLSPQQDRGIGQAAWQRGGRATHSSPQAAMGQCDPESSTAGTQSPRQGQYLSRVHFSHLMAREAGDKDTEGYPGSVHCSWDAGSTKPSRSETTLSRAQRSCQRQAGQCFLPLHACPVGLGMWGQWAQTGLSS